MPDQSNKPTLKPATLIFNQQEAEAVLAFLDIAVKARGLEVAQDAAYLRNKFAAAFEAAQKIVPAEIPADPVKA